VHSEAPRCGRCTDAARLLLQLLLSAAAACGWLW
jgi:hypothetical protein